MSNKIICVLIYGSVGLIFAVNAHYGMQQCPPTAKPTDLDKVTIENCDRNSVCYLDSEYSSIIVHYNFTAPYGRDVCLNKMSCSMQLYIPVSGHYIRGSLSVIDKDGCEYSPESEEGPIQWGETVHLKCSLYPEMKFDCREEGDIFVYILWDGEQGADFDCVTQHFIAV